MPQSLRPAPLRSPRRAKAHARTALPALTPALLTLLTTVAACGPAGSDSGPRAAVGSRANPAEQIELLLEAYEPVPLDATSDKQDAALRRQRDVMEELRGGDRELGLAALAAFRAHAHASDLLREALLEVAAVCDPQGTAPLLEHMVVTYDAALGLAVRTRAAELLAQTAPRRALEVLAPLILGADPNVTLPPREKLVRAWAQAVRGAGSDDLGVLVDVTIDLSQPPGARYAAIDELGTFGGDLPRKALEEVLTEPSSDSYLRRKAAQALEAFLSPEELCPILQRVSSSENDAVFLEFLASMETRNGCP